MEFGHFRASTAAISEGTLQEPDAIGVQSRKELQGDNTEGALHGSCHPQVSSAQSSPASVATCVCILQTSLAGADLACMAVYLILVLFPNIYLRFSLCLPHSPS